MMCSGVLYFQPARADGAFAGKIFIKPAPHQGLLTLELRLLRAQFIGTSYLLDAEKAEAVRPVLERAAEEDEKARSGSRHDQLTHLARLALRRVEVAEVLSGDTRFARSEAGRMVSDLPATDRAEFLACLRVEVGRIKRARRNQVPAADMTPTG